MCEICGNDEIIFPWDPNSTFCHQCAAVYHRVCWSKCNHCCPKCKRIEQRRARNSQKLIDENDIEKEDKNEEKQQLSTDTDKNIML